MKREINPEVCRYIGNEILPKYRQLKGHTDSHITDVIERSLKIAQDLEDINIDMVYVIAAYHDLGRLIDNKTHHIESGKMLRADKILRTFFNDEEIEIMAEAVEDHRASLKSDPRSLYGRIVSSADRSCDVNEILARAYDYNRALNPDLSEREAIEVIRLILRGKYIPGAYADKKMYFRTPEYDIFLRKVEEITATPEGFYKVQTEFNRKRFGDKTGCAKRKSIVIIGASRKGYEMAQKRFGKRHRVLRVDPDNVADAKKNFAELITDKTPIVVFGPVGSNVIPIGTEVYVTECRWLDAKLPNASLARLRKPRLSGAPSLGVPCYTNDKFVTETDIKEPVVFDKVLAYLIRDGFNVVSSWRIVSDNLSKEQFKEFIDH
ncbi:HD domain-containing protein [Candidatus Saccharibacteria bacterium]|nr:HD domain-containing protein [Candidatus Saccharibacteria bacterium]